MLGPLVHRAALADVSLFPQQRLQTTVPIYVLYRKNGYLTGASRTLLTLITNVPVRPSNPAHRDRDRK